MSQHRTLRTCLDPGSSKWNSTTMQEKLEILKKVAAIKDLQFIFTLYKKEYEEMNNPQVANALENGLTELLKYVFNNIAT